MGVEELDKLVEESDDKFAILTNVEILRQYNLLMKDVHYLYNKYLSDEEKEKIIELPDFNDKIKKRTFSIITNESIILKLLNNKDFIEKIDKYSIENAISKLTEKNIIEILSNKDLINSFNLDLLQIRKIYGDLSQEGKLRFLENKEIIVNAGLVSFQISELISQIESEEKKQRFIEEYEMKGSDEVSILETFSDDSKIEILQKRYRRI